MEGHVHHYQSILCISVYLLFNLSDEEKHLYCLFVFVDLNKKKLKPNAVVLANDISLFYLRKSHFFIIQVKISKNLIPENSSNQNGFRLQN